MIKKTFLEDIEGRVEVSSFMGGDECRAFLEYLDKCKALGINFAGIEFSAGSDFIIDIQLDLDKTKWVHPNWPKAKATIRTVERKY